MSMLYSKSSTIVHWMTGITSLAGCCRLFTPSIHPAYIYRSILYPYAHASHMSQRFPPQTKIKISIFHRQLRRQKLHMLGKPHRRAMYRDSGIHNVLSGCVQGGDANKWNAIVTRTIWVYVHKCNVDQFIVDIEEEQPIIFWSFFLIYSFEFKFYCWASRKI